MPILVRSKPYKNLSIALWFILLFSYTAIFSQDINKNAFSTSLIRIESNSKISRTTFRRTIPLKFMTAIEYQRIFGKWSFGIQYENGFKKVVFPPQCCDNYYGTGYFKENNFFVKSTYTLTSLFDSKIRLNVGLGIYYSNSNYSGNFSGGFFGNGFALNNTYNFIGLSPSFTVQYHSMQRLFVAIHFGSRFGIGQVSNTSNTYTDSEYVFTFPDLKIGALF